MVGEVLPGSVPGRLGDGRGGALLSGLPEAPQHLVTLSSIEDDALGEELQVVEELIALTRDMREANARRGRAVRRGCAIAVTIAAHWEARASAAAIAAGQTASR